MKYFKKLHDSTDVTERIMFLIFGAAVIMDMVARWT